MRTSRTVITVAMLVLAGACSRSPAPEAAPAPMPTSSRAIAVQVDNQNFSDMNVYLVSRGARWLVGVAPGIAKTTLTIPASLAPADQRVKLRAEPVGGGGWTMTPTLIVPPGQQVFWSIGADVHMSNATAG